jgi:hypothetical protein
LYGLCACIYSPRLQEFYNDTKPCPNRITSSILFGIEVVHIVNIYGTFLFSNTLEVLNIKIGDENEIWPSGGTPPFEEAKRIVRNCLLLLNVKCNVSIVCDGAWVTQKIKVAKIKLLGFYSLLVAYRVVGLDHLSIKSLVYL